MSDNVDKFCEALRVNLSRTKNFIAKVGEGIQSAFGVKTFTVYSMLTKQERENLFRLAKNTPLKKGDSILEFGVFFGGSSEALGKGLALNKTSTENKIFAVDTFCCSKPGGLYEIVFERAKLVDGTQFLEKNGSTVDWYKYVQSNLKRFENIELLQQDSKGYEHDGSPVAILHLDLPKFYSEMHIILAKVVGFLKPGAFIVFQDFFYHWSAEIIAFIYFLIKNEKVAFQYAQDPTLAVKNINLSSKDLEDFRLVLQSYEKTRDLLFESINFLKMHIQPSQTENLYMAIVQYSTQHQDVASSEKAMGLVGFPNASDHVVRIHQELAEYNFDLRQSYLNNFIDLPFEKSEKVARF
ncbi:hypothetical protein N9B71_02075 [Pirellulales bacterium]|nr:hypothetical protein [Pirellulales bacterium]